MHLMPEIAKQKAWLTTLTTELRERLPPGQFILIHARMCFRILILRVVPDTRTVSRCVLVLSRKF